MSLVGIFLAIISFLFGLRLLITALQAALSGKVLVRQGIRTKWQPAPDMGEVWRLAFRDALMGVLLITLAIMLII